MYNFIIFTDYTDPLIVAKTLGAYKCAHALRSAGYSCLVVDHFHTYNLNELSDLLHIAIGSNTMAVGFSTTFFTGISDNKLSLLTQLQIELKSLPDGCFCPQGIIFEEELINLIKNINSKIKIIVGGTKVYREYSNRHVDYALVGYSESTFVNLAKYINGDQSLGPSYKNVWGVTVLTDVGYESYDFKNTPFVWQATDVVNAKVLPLEITRGCIFSCKFCSFPLIGKTGNDFIKSFDLLYQEMLDNYHNYGITSYYIVDDTFNDNETKLNLMQDIIKKLPFKPTFWAYTRLDLIASKNNFNKLIDIGLRGFFFGIETLNQQTGKIIGKGADPAKLISTICKIRQEYKNDILMHGQFIIGLPKESMSSIDETFNGIMNQSIPLHSWHFGGLWIPQPNKVTWLSEFSKNYKEYGYTEITGDTTISTGYTQLGNNILDINWQNEYMTRDEANYKSQELVVKSLDSDKLHLNSSTAWNLQNYNYSWSELSTTPQKEFKLTRVQKIIHVKEYKKQLLKLISASTPGYTFP